jgi:hypothetical protein
MDNLLLKYINTCFNIRASLNRYLSLTQKFSDLLYDLLNTFKYKYVMMAMRGRNM